MTETFTGTFTAMRRPQRADARRNFDALLAAARVVFAEGGTDASLEEIARRAGVGVGTLYRHFPTRQDLIESVYADEVEAVCRTAVEYARLEPWEALAAWLRRVVAYIGTKRALLEGLNRTSDVLRNCREMIYRAGEPLLARAQAAGVARAGITIDDVVRLITGVAPVGIDEAQRERILAMALDGIRTYRPDEPAESPRSLPASS